MDHTEDRVIGLVKGCHPCKTRWSYCILPEHHRNPPSMARGQNRGKPRAAWRTTLGIHNATQNTHWKNRPKKENEGQTERAIQTGVKQLESQIRKTTAHTLGSKSYLLLVCTIVCPHLYARRDRRTACRQIFAAQSTWQGYKKSRSLVILLISTVIVHEHGRLHLLSHPDQCQVYAKIGLLSLWFTTSQGASLRDCLHPHAPTEKVTLWMDRTSFTECYGLKLTRGCLNWESDQDPQFSRPSTLFTKLSLRSNMIGLPSPVSNFFTGMKLLPKPTAAIAAAIYPAHSGMFSSWLGVVVIGRVVVLVYSVALLISVLYIISISQQDRKRKHE